MRHMQTLTVAAALPWRPVLSLTGAGLALLAVSAAWPTGAVSRLALILGVGALAAGTAYLLDEAADEAVSAVPISLRSRAGTGLLCAAAVFAAGLGGLAVVAQRSEMGARIGITVPLAGCILVALAASAALRRHLAEPGELVAGALLALVALLVLTRALDRWVELFPGEATARWPGSLAVWGCAALVSIATITRATRDPWD